MKRVVMNKAKTVDLGTLNWILRDTKSINKLLSATVPFPFTGKGRDPINAYSSIGYMGSSDAAILSSTLDVAQRGVYNFNATGSGTTIYVVVPVSQTAITGTLTYETATPRRCLPVTYKAQQLVKDEDTLVGGYGITASFDGDTHRIQISGTATGFFSRANHIVELPTLSLGHLYACILNGTVSQSLYLNHNSTTNFGTIGRTSKIVQAVGAVGECFVGCNVFEGDTANIDATLQIVDLTDLYGAGNEPTSVNTFLSQHPEYNSYVPFYDGKITQRRIIETKAKQVDLQNVTFGYDGTYNRFYTRDIPYKWRGIRLSHIFAKGYETLSNGENFDVNWDKVVYSGNESYIYFHDHAFNDANAFKQHLVETVATITYETQ